MARSDTPCTICSKPAVWLYTGAIYAAGDTPDCCAACIADGRLEQALGRDNFSLHDAELTGVSEDLACEVLLRTPGFSTYNAFDWPVQQGGPLAFIGHGDNPVFESDVAARTAIRAAGAALGEDDWDYPAPYALLFRVPDTDSYVAVTDLD